MRTRQIPQRKGIIRTSISSFLQKIVFSSQGLPIFLTAAILGFLLVLFRMKSVEQDYQLNDINKNTKKISYENKDLKAKRANKLSVRNLRKMANKYQLNRPKQNQVIVIP